VITHFDFEEITRTEAPYSIVTECYTYTHQ